MCRALESISVPLRAPSYCYYDYIQHNKAFSIRYPLSHPLLLCRSCIIRNGNECICGFWKLEPTGWFHSAPIRIQSALRFYSVLQCFYILAHSMYKQTTGGKQRLEHGFTMSFTFFCLFISLTLWSWPPSVGLRHHAVLCQQTGQKGLLWKVRSLHGFLPKQRGWNVSLASAPQWGFFFFDFSLSKTGRRVWTSKRRRTQVEGIRFRSLELCGIKTNSCGHGLGAMHGGKIFFLRGVPF